MDLRVEEVKYSNSKKEVKEMYHSSFSKEDRMPFALMVLMSYLWNTEFLAFYDDELCGFVYMATISKQTFVMFIAVKENLQSKGYGSRMLEIIQKMHAHNKIIISIEPYDENAKDIENRVKRKLFYLRNGYFETGYLMKLGVKKQEILIKNGVFDKLRFQLFFMIYSSCMVIPKIWKIDNNM